MRARSEATVNPGMATGEIEVYGIQLEILNTAQTPPFQLDDFVTVGEDVRLKYRYMDLRRTEMQNSLRFRSKITSSIRNYLVDDGFLRYRNAYHDARNARGCSRLLDSVADSSRSVLRHAPVSAAV